MANHHKTQPPNYEGSLSATASEERADKEDLRDVAYENAGAETNAILRTKAFRLCDMLDTSLDFQGANPKKLDFETLRDHIRAPSPNHEDVTNQYRASIKNRATAIRAYCIGCQGGSVVDVRFCPSMTCPLHAFRMGKDPLRGYAMPIVEEPELELDEDDVGEFEEGHDDGD